MPSDKVIGSKTRTETETSITGCKMAAIVDQIKTRYYAFKLIFTIVLCLIPYVFLRCTLYAALIIIVIKVIKIIWKRMTDTKIEPGGRGVFITGCDSGKFFFIFRKVGTQKNIFSYKNFEKNQLYDCKMTELLSER